MSAIDEVEPVEHVGVAFGRGNARRGHTGGDHDQDGQDERGTGLLGRLFGR